MQVNHVTKARKDQGRCESCGEPITKGDGYKSISPRYGATRKRCVECPSWRLSEMTSSKASTAYAAQESGHDQLDALAMAVIEDAATALVFVADVEAILADVADGADECAGDYQDGYDNMPENFQGGPTGEDILEKIDMLESWASSLRDWSPDVDAASAVETVPDDDDDPFASWADDVQESARAVIDELEL